MFPGVSFYLTKKTILNDESHSDFELFDLKVRSEMK